VQSGVENAPKGFTIGDTAMTAFSPRSIALAFLGASTALAFVASPFRITTDGLVPGLVHSAALAKDGKSGSDDNSGSDRSGSGHEDDDDNSGSGSSGSGSSGSDDDDDDEHDDNVSGRRGAEHINPATGDKVEIQGSSIEVRHADGTKEEIEGGRYEMKDRSGRTIIERRATEADRARLMALAG
jgi:hypothetical protein